MNAKLEIKRPLTSSSRLKKFLFIYLAIGSLALVLTLSSAIILPLYSRLKASEDRNIKHAVEIRAMAISEWARRSKDLAWQITSRTRIRQELKKYNNGEISLDQVKSFTEPKLADAMNLSKEILGIIRLDNKEQLVSKCGLNVPKEKWPLSDITLKNITVSQPSIISDYSVFIVRAPILSHDGAYEGADLIVIDLSNLKAITSNYSGLGKTSQIILGYSFFDNSINQVFPLKSQNLDVDNGQTFNSTVATLLKKGINGNKGLEKIDKNVFAYTPLVDFSWVLLISQSENELYASLNNKLLIIGSSLIFIYLVFILGFWLIMNPLSGRLLMHAEELEESIIKKTQYLNDEILIRQKSEKKLRQSEEMMLNSQSVAHICSYSTDLNAGEIEKSAWVCSPEFYKIFGIDKTYPHTIEGWANFIHPDDRKEVFDYHESVVKEKKMFSREYKIIRINDGEERWVHGTGKLEFDEKGNPVRMHGAIQDITERKNLEFQVQQAQKMESIGNLAGGIAHDFNNLLYPIIGFAEMLIEDLPPKSPEHESAQAIFNAGKRGCELVKQILAFSRQVDHQLSPVRFQKILAEVFKLTRSTIPSDIEIYQDIQKDCGLVMAEETQLHQIAMNLITNAYHAVEKTGGKISVQLKEITLDNDDLKDRPLQVGQYVMLSVSDNGVGIPREIMNNIFDPYFTTKEQGKGTGLGLAVVYGILREHKGDVKVYSEVGKGTTFNVYLPVMKESDEPISTEKELYKLTGTERILLVDDEISVVRLEKQMLERLGYKVSAWSNSIEALETFNSNPDGYDLVISDMTMPNMTGDQLAKELMAIRPDIPIIICTGFSERINKEQAEANKVKGFLMKPVVKSEMAQMVRKVLDEAKVYKGN
ncbi:putative sensorkinase/phosphatase protein (plasmid) [Desulforapulum autotrophicum HRM2]|uniref:histidine kinase n=2 Tax=Desulforapulum autotrophicum TaxID=2296 RepID=C0QMM5_DESAH|nr:putative sensorkinase/phosphatase protein [Desulforapulum autotrophicum HRM2]